jgi:hypothetical protein
MIGAVTELLICYNLLATIRPRLPGVFRFRHCHGFFYQVINYGGKLIAIDSADFGVDFATAIRQPDSVSIRDFVIDYRYQSGKYQA